jgi:hypothetical protein
MTEGRVKKREIEGGGVERECAGVTLLEREPGMRRPVLTRPSQEDRRRIEADAGGDARPGRQNARERSGPASDVEHARVGRKRDF